MIKKDNNSHKVEEPHLRIYENRSTLIEDDGTSQNFIEGKSSSPAQKRFLIIKTAFEKGFLINEIKECQKPDLELEPLPEEQMALLANLVESVTSERGRAVVGLVVLQLCIKSICPEQSIRLHKSSPRRGTFSWQEGISMRTLDANYVTPKLREYGLLSVNMFGVMMTRTLAENYPYTGFFKAKVRGAKSEWLEIVNQVEQGEMNAVVSLRHLLVMLHRRSERFKSLVGETMSTLEGIKKKQPTLNNVFEFIRNFVCGSQYSPRLLEIAMHSLFQVFAERGALDGHLKPLSQMRSANKKHGDIADIQVISVPGVLQIIEAWDAKFGKPYLRDELEELNDKLSDHPETELAGFVVEEDPTVNDEILKRIEEIGEEHNIELKLLSFENWVADSIDRTSGEKENIGLEWLIAFVETLCQLRREIAPIDEPSDRWVEDINKAMQIWLRSL